jgi:hypothetical protein
MGAYTDPTKWPKTRSEAIDRAKTFLRLYRDLIGDESGEVSVTIRMLDLPANQKPVSSPHETDPVRH